MRFTGNNKMLSGTSWFPPSQVAYAEFKGNSLLHGKIEKLNLRYSSDQYSSNTLVCKRTSSDTAVYYFNPSYDSYSGCVCQTAYYSLDTCW